LLVPLVQVTGVISRAKRERARHMESNHDSSVQSFTLLTYQDVSLRTSFYDDV